MLGRGHSRDEPGGERGGKGALKHEALVSHPRPFNSKPYSQAHDRREEATQAEMLRMTEEINDTRLFRERKALMETELAEVRAEVAALKVS